MGVGGSERRGLYRHIMLIYWNSRDRRHIAGGIAGMCATYSQFLLNSKLFVSAEEKWKEDDFYGSNDYE